MGKPVYIVVTPFFPSSNNWRGAYCYDFVRALIRTEKYDVRVFVPTNGADGGYEYQGVRVTTFRTRQLPSAVLPFLFARWNTKSFLRAVKRSGVEIADVAVCHGHTAFFGIYPLAVKSLNPSCLTLLHHHDPQSFGLNLGCLRHVWLYNLIMFPILRRLHEKIDCHVFISEIVRRSFMSVPCVSWTEYDGYRRQMRGLGFCRGVRIKRGIILHNGVDTKCFSPLSDNLHNARFTIGCIGSFIDWKDQITLLRAVDILGRVEHVESGMKIVFVGSGPEREKCERYAREMGIDAEFRNEVRHEQLGDFYHGIDLFVLPSYFEGFGCVFTEAWACGVPFITCEGQGMDDMIYEEDRGLWLCKPRNPEELAARIKYFMENRPVQSLKGEIDIDKLVQDFVNEV